MRALALTLAAIALLSSAHRAHAELPLAPPPVLVAAPVAPLLKPLIPLARPAVPLADSLLEWKVEPFSYELRFKLYADFLTGPNGWFFSYSREVHVEFGTSPLLRICAETREDAIIAARRSLPEPKAPYTFADLANELTLIIQTDPFNTRPGTVPEGGAYQIQLSPESAPANFQAVMLNAMSALGPVNYWPVYVHSPTEPIDAEVTGLCGADEPKGVQTPGPRIIRSGLPPLN